MADTTINGTSGTSFWDRFRADPQKVDQETKKLKELIEGVQSFDPLGINGALNELMQQVMTDLAGKDESAIRDYLRQNPELTRMLEPILQNAAPASSTT